MSVKEEHMRSLAEYRCELLKKPVLKFLFFELTDCCNLACRHCGSSCSPKKSTFLKKESVFKVLDSVKERYGNQPMICLTGGEPLMHPDFFEIAQYIAANGFYWGITTNATLIDKSVATELSNCRMTSVAFSLDGEIDSHNALRGSKTAYDRAVRGIRNTVEYCKRAVTMVTTVVNKLNFDELDDIYNSVCALGVDSWRVVNVDPIGRATDSDLALDDNQLIELFDYIKNLRRKSDIEVTYGCSHYLTEQYERELRDSYFLCASGIYTASVLANGDIFSCLDIERLPELVQGNVEKDDFADVWENKFAVFRQDRTALNDTCNRCSDKLYCAGDSAHTWDFRRNRPNLCVKKILDKKGESC